MWSWSMRQAIFSPTSGVVAANRRESSSRKSSHLGEILLRIQVRW